MIKLSIVIPTKNRADRIEKLLYSLSKQDADLETFEIIVFDNGSEDNTCEICKRFSGETRNLVYQFDDTPGLHIGRNWGYQHAKGDIIVYLDDDVIPLTNRYISRIQEAFLDDSVGMVVGSILPHYESQPPRWVKKISQKSGIYNMIIDFSCVEINAQDGDEVSPYYAFGANFIIRKSILEECNGFHPDGMPKELLMYRGDGETHVANYVASSDYRVIFYKDVSVYHSVTKERMTYEYINMIGFRTGISIAYSQLRDDETPETNRIPLFSDKLTRIQNKAINCGILFLKKQFHENSDVREWIKQSDYLNNNGVIPSRR